MKNYIEITLLTMTTLFSVSSFAARHCSDDDTVIYAKTLNHKKEVEICKVGERFRYTFGKTDSTPDIVLERTYSEININNTRFLKSVEIYNGNITYDVGFFTNGEETDSNNVAVGDWNYAIIVSKNNNKISEIKLDPNTLIDNTTKYAVETSTY